MRVIVSLRVRVCMCVLSRPGDVALFAYSAGAQVPPSFTQRCLPRRALAGSSTVGSGPPLTPQHFGTQVETDRKRERRTQKGEPGLRFKAKPDAKGKVCVCELVRLPDGSRGSQVTQEA